MPHSITHAPGGSRGNGSRRRRRVLTATLAVGAASAVAVGVAMADSTITVPGYQRTSDLDVAGPGTMDVESWSFSARAGDAKSKSGQQTDYGPITVTRDSDVNSPRFAMESINGQGPDGGVFRDVKLRQYQPSQDTMREYLAVCLTNARVIGYSVDASADQVPTEEITFDYDAIVMGHADETGKPVNAVNAGWDIAGDKPLNAKCL